MNPQAAFFFDNLDPIITLLVTGDGFPVAYEVIKVSTFEGHTMITVTVSFIKKHQIKHFTVAADASLISADKVKSLVKSEIHYIAGEPPW